MALQLLAQVAVQFVSTYARAQPEFTGSQDA